MQLSDQQIDFLATRVAEKVSEKQPICSMGFSHEDVSEMKGIINQIRKARNLLGTLVISAIILFAIGCAALGFKSKLGM